MWQFGDVEVDVARREVRRAGDVQHLEPQAFDLLVCLIEHRDRVVSKPELLDGVWGHAFLSESNVTTRIKEVRRAVGDDGTRQGVIRNVRGRGYRFVAELTDDRVATAGLVGRDVELLAVRSALRRAPLTTLVGPGGVGKSTLARVAVVPETAAVVVELATVERDGDVTAAVARALGLEHHSDRAAAETIRAMARAPGPLVLDGCEHVVEQAAVLVERLVAMGGPLRVLATSQVPLGVSGEVVVDVRPLDRDAARALFEERASAVAWSPVEPSRVERLVDALDRLPLTIEMAAARLRSMTFEDLERVVVGGPGLVRVSHRTPTPRHRSLEAVVTWAVDLLEPRQREVLGDFSVFGGAVGLEDAEAVLGPVVLDLAALADRSLLVADVAGVRTRYSMLSTVRDVAASWPSGARTAAVRARHADHLLDVLRDVDDRIRTPDEAAARRRIDALVDEVRVAHRWCRSERPDVAAALSEALFHPAYSTLWHEPADWSRELVDAPGAALVVAGAAAHRGELEAARRWCEPIADEADGRLRAKATELLGDVAMYQGDLELVLRAGDELRALGEAQGDLHASTIGVVDRALGLAYGGDPGSAMDELDRGFGGSPVALAPTDRAWLAYARGEALGTGGDGVAAAARYREAIELAEPIGIRFIVSVARVSLADAVARSGDAAAALQAYAACLDDLGRRGNTTHAVTAIRNLLGLLAAIGDDHGVALLVGCLEGGGHRSGYGAEAARTAEVVEALRSRVPSSELDRWMAEGRALADDPIGAAGSLVAARLSDATG